MTDNGRERQMQATIDDTQAALAASLARIEAFRIRERQLIAEVAALRQQVHGPKRANEAAPAAGPKAAPPATSPDQQPQPEQSPLDNLQDLSAASTCSISIPPQPKQPAFTALGSEAPLYVSSMNPSEEVVSVWMPGERGHTEKVNCQLIMDKDRLDFVQLRVRIKADDFIGITAVKESRSKTPASTSKGLFCCFSPSALGDDGKQDTPAAVVPTVAAPQADLQDLIELDTDAPSSTLALPQRGRYRIYLRGREQRPVEFDASQTTRATLHKHTQKWLGQEDEVTDGTADVAGNEAKPHKPEDVVAPKHLVPGPPMRLLGDPSHILSANHISAIASAIPPLERMRDWTLAYSTKVHGISLATLYRKVHSGQVPTLLAIRDNSGHVFGCYTPEGWRIAPRYYGSGETFVFQVEPARVMWPWQSKSTIKNDFFQYSTPDCLALGGLGHFALHVDQELLQGSSGQCGTFGSPCLSGKEDFKVQILEVWQVAA